MAETVDAKAKLGRNEALALASKASKVIVSKGRNVVSFSTGKDRPDDATLLSHVLGPTGNLRAPTIRSGKTLYVGFNEETLRDLL